MAAKFILKSMVTGKTRVFSRAGAKETSRLDWIREQRRVPLAKLNEMLPKIVGRQVKSISQLSSGESRHVARVLSEGRI